VLCELTTDVVVDGGTIRTPRLPFVPLLFFLSVISFFFFSLRRRRRTTRRSLLDRISIYNIIATRYYKFKYISSFFFSSQKKKYPRSNDIVMFNMRVSKAEVTAEVGGIFVSCRTPCHRWWAQFNTVKIERKKKRDERTDGG